MRGFMGSDRTYDVSALSRGGGGGAGGGAKAPVLGQEERGTKRKAGGVDIALDAADLEGLTENELRQRYEAAGNQRGGTHEDFSDFAAKEVAKRRKMGKSSSSFNMSYCPPTSSVPDFLASWISQLKARRRTRRRKSSSSKSCIPVCDLLFPMCCNVSLLATVSAPE